jgi:hypothetical protein
MKIINYRAPGGIAFWKKLPFTMTGLSSYNQAKIWLSLHFNKMTFVLVPAGNSPFG